MHHGALCMTVTASFFVAGAGRCDLKIVTEVNTSGRPMPIGLPSRGNGGPEGSGEPARPPETADPSASSTTTLTTYYKDKMVRVETGAIVELYDVTAKKVYRLNPAQKTYCQLSLDAVLRQPVPALAHIPEGLRMDLQAEVDATGLTQTVAGRAARKYTLDGYFRLMREAVSGQGTGFPGSGRRGGGRRGGGGAPGGPDGNGGGAPPGGGGSVGGAVMPTTLVDGEYWLVDASLLPTGSKSLILPLVEPTITAGPILKPLDDRFMKLKMIPLASRVTMRTPAPNASDAPFVITTEVKSIDETTLDDALFKTPADYQKIEPAAFERQMNVKTPSLSAPAR
jgi:hypothetical protein